MWTRKILLAFANPAPDLTLGGAAETDVTHDVSWDDPMVTYLLWLSVLLGIPMSAFAQFVDKGGYVEVKKGTALCSDVKLEKERGTQEPGRVFWKVTSKMRANGTQTVAAFVHETVYDSKSGDTTIKESLYQEDFATFFKRDPEHKGMLLMISPQNGRVEAIVEVCAKKK